MKKIKLYKRLFLLSATISLFNCASPKLKYQMEAVCQQVVELNTERLYLKIEKINAAKKTDPDTSNFDTDLKALDKKIDQKLLECKTLRKKADRTFSVLDFMHFLGTDVKKKEIERQETRQ